MTLIQLHKAIRPQFPWQNEPFKKLKLKSNDKAERYQGFAPMVFIGIANSFGIPKIDICEYLEVQPNEYESKLKDFMEYLDEIRQRKDSGTICMHKDFTDRVYLKTKLTLNAINSQFRNETIHCTLHL